MLRLTVTVVHHVLGLLLNLERLLGQLLLNLLRLDLFLLGLLLVLEHLLQLGVHSFVLRLQFLGFDGE